MRTTALTRRILLGAGVCALAAASEAPAANVRAAAGLSPKNDEAIRKYYAGWETDEWQPLDNVLSDNFTFTSPNDDDHISKAAFKTRCWESQVKYIDRFDLKQVIGSGNDAFVLYVCRTKNGKTFRNVEYLRLNEGKIEAIECYFGAQSSFASAVGGSK
jgi:ketosteroid isomerase-like protein